MILDKQGKPIPQKSIGEQYAEALARSARSYKWQLETHLLDGWTIEEHRHWVETGEEPHRA